MKKLTVVFAVLAVFAGTSAFANKGEDVSKAVQNAFQKSFSNAENVTWQVTEDFYFASFTLNGKTVDAAYNENGELLGIARKMQLSDIPLNVSQSIKSAYAGYEISNSVTEMVLEGEPFYYATVAGQTKILKLKCLSDGEIFIEKRTKK